MGELSYRVGGALDVAAIAGLYEASTLAERRPYADRVRLATVLAASNLVVTAWDGARPVGIARCMSDLEHVTYVADLAVDAAYQRQGIGRELLAHVRAAAPRTRLVLLAAPGARDYYRRIGFDHHDAAWTLSEEGRLT